MITSVLSCVLNREKDLCWLVGLWSLSSICCAHLYSSSLSSFVSGLDFGGLDFDGYFISAHNPVVHHIFAQHKASSTRTEESLCPKHN